MIFVILTVGIAAAAVLGFLLGTQQAEPCACVSAGLPRPTYYGRHDGGIVVGERGEVRVRPVNGRNLGTQPRRTPRPGPFTAADMPALPAPEPSGPARAWDPGDGLGELAPLARPWTAERVAYGVDRCQLDVAEAERRFALALGPDGCEET